MRAKVAKALRKEIRNTVGDNIPWVNYTKVQGVPHKPSHVVSYKPAQTVLAGCCKALYKELKKQYKKKEK